MSMLPISRKTALLPLVAVASLTIAAAGPVRAADPAAGEADFKKICAKCHTIAADQAGKKKLDPPLHGVIGRKAGSVAGFRYSGAMTASNVVWSARTLDGWLTKPKDFIPKTRMPFGGWTQAERRANVIAYVREASEIAARARRNQRTRPMFIQTEDTASADRMRFIPGRDVLGDGQVTFSAPEEAAGSPLARRLFEVSDVRAVTLGADDLVVEKAESAEWHHVKPRILAAIMEHFMGNDPVIDTAGTARPMATSEADGEIIAQLEELIENRVRPAVSAQGGDVRLASYLDGVVELEVSGPATDLLGPIGNMMRHYIPEVTSVREYRDTSAMPGLFSAVGVEVQRLIDQQINPAVASHGGFISLEGGCQGCGMADVTLKQGIETTIRQHLPDITAVRDVTDHAGGSNPYYQPSQK